MLIINMTKIRFSDYVKPAILTPTKRELRKGSAMKNGKNQVMTCGACAIIVGESGQTTTSIDSLVNGVKRFTSKLSRR